jgi:CBS domain containing-hemolysin-like protein
MIQSIIRFSDRTAGEVMTPRTNIVPLRQRHPSKPYGTHDRVQILRLPVYRERMDHIEGTIYVRDLLTYWAA